MKITTNLDKTIELDENTSVLVYLDNFLSGWGRAEGQNHYGVILTSDSITGASYMLKNYASVNDKTIKNVRIMKLKDTAKLLSVSYYNGFRIANINGVEV